MLESVRWYFGTPLPFVTKVPRAGSLRTSVRILPDIFQSGYFLPSLAAFLFNTDIYRLMQA